MPISTPGVGSGLDVNGIVSQLMAIERRPLTAIDSRQQGIRAQLSAFGTIKNALAGLQTSVQGLQTNEKFLSFKTTVSDEKVLTASASASAVAGSFGVEVSALAKAQQLSKGGFATSSDVVGTGTLRIELGSYTSGVFTANPDKAAKDVTILPATNTLAGIRDAINKAGAGVSATIVNGVSGSQLFVTANDTGITNSVRITATDDDGNNIDDAGLSKLVFDPTTAGGNVSNLIETTPASNAALKINGIDVSSASNAVSGAIDGITLNLIKTNVGTPIDVTVSQDTTAIKDKLTAFVKAYNDVRKAVKDLTAFDPVTNTSAPLNGDSAARAAQGRLRTILTSVIDGGTAGALRLPDIGITFQADGSLAIDDRKLQKALDDPNKNVASLFIETSDVKGYAAQLNTAITSMLESEGLIAGRTDGLGRSIRELDKRRESIENRMELIERRLRAQFTALDAAVARMQTTSSFLTQQLSSLSANKG
jgi:flagellar hook-associated protein 2